MLKTSLAKDWLYFFFKSIPGNRLCNIVCNIICLRTSCCRLLYTKRRRAELQGQENASNYFVFCIGSTKNLKDNC